MRITRSTRKHAARRREELILFSAGPYPFAIAARAVEKIENSALLRAAGPGFGHGKLSKIKHVLFQGAQQYFVVDAGQQFRIPSSTHNRVLLLRDISVGLNVDAIDRMVEVSTLHALPRAFTGEERDWYRGLVIVDERVVPVIRAEAILGRSDLLLAQQIQQNTAALATHGASA